MRKVLIVEDSPVMRGMLETLVDTLGDVEVEAVENGLEALRFYLPLNFPSSLPI